MVRNAVGACSLTFPVTHPPHRIEMALAEQVGLVRCEEVLDGEGGESLDGDGLGGTMVTPTIPPARKLRTNMYTIRSWMVSEPRCAAVPFLLQVG